MEVEFPEYFDDLESSEDEIQSTTELITGEEAQVPSLVDLCTKELRNRIFDDDDYNVEDLCELPPHLFEPLVTGLPAAALENLERRRRMKDRGDQDECSSEIKKFKRFGVFNEAWRSLYEMRFMMTELVLGAEPVESELYVDWMLAYWQRHLQECIDLATEQVFQPSFEGHLSQIPMSTKLLEQIGYKGEPSPSLSNSMMLSFHCHRYGQYARCLKIRNVICTPELCDLLKTCKLTGLVLRRIRKNKEVKALCELLKLNIKSLRYLHFIDSTLISRDVERICRSLRSNELGTHMLQHLHVLNSRLGGSYGFEPFLLGRILRSISISNTTVSREFAERVFSILFDTSSSVEALDLSESYISSWFSKLRQSVPQNSLKSLRKLSLRGNNMQNMDIDDLKFALNFIPNLDTLDLKDNPLGDEGIINLVTYMSEMTERNTFLKHLKLDNCLLSCDGAKHILEILSGMKNQLFSLSIADNDLGSQIAVPLSRFLLTTSILDLNVELTGFGASGFEILEREITGKLQLRKINISRNRGKSATAKLILKLISQAPELQTIDASENLMPPESLLEVCSALTTKTGNIEMVDLAGNIYNPSLDAVAADLRLKEKPVVMLPRFCLGHFIHDDDP